ncbi:hypothetical protein [Bacillus pseudomycoides]|uniref:hypothetical protein n=1 Tax=Bacillus pseudomycoides TaxID=64104 RepID=UPI000BF1116D|nr:hypothetical protein [Bacillus pseudomycoides]PEJ68695.1 hypothetical protein CN680_26085 [Bacillus pseudomycoides]PGD26784.1 hypothetical protein COM32_12835 [Bacillus pseudomycoides]PHG24717.1 hypothetical protein COI47_07970 [Bacillus pseudomycoides]
MTLSDRVLHQIAGEVFCYIQTDSEVKEVLLCSDLFDAITTDGEVITEEDNKKIFNINRWNCEEENIWENVIIHRFDDMDCMISFEEL